METIDDAFKDMLKSLRQFEIPQSKKRRTKVLVTPANSVEVGDFEGQLTADQSKPCEEQGHGQIMEDLDQTELRPTIGK